MKLEIGNVVKNCYGTLGIVIGIKPNVFPIGNPDYADVFKILSFGGKEINTYNCRFVAKNVSSYIRKYVGKYDNLQKG